MTDQDARLRRLFAENAATLPGEKFVADVRSRIITRRRRARQAVAAAWGVSVLVLALLLAPSIDNVASAGLSLAQWPERILDTLATRADALKQPAIPFYMYWVLASCALPAVVIGWIFLRMRRSL